MLAAVLCLLLCAGALGEETPPEKEHTDAHVTVEVAAGKMQIIRTENPETHTCVVRYDLYCVECDKVVAANVRQEEFEEAHSWVSTRREPSCEADGTELKKCVICGYELEIPLIAAGHQWSDWEEDAIDPSLVCLTDKTARRVCQVCGETETMLVSPAPGHQWSSGVSYPPTCTEPGRVVRVCSGCGLEETIVLSNSPALGHLFADPSVLSGYPAGNVMASSDFQGIVIGVVETPSACTEDGQGTMLCIRCQQASRSVSIPSTGHAWGEWQVDLKPKDQICESEVTSTRICRVCKAEEKRVDGPAPGHQWVTLAYTMPTCTEPGTALRICDVCGMETTVEYPPLGHSYVWIEVTVPSPTSDGLSEYTCALCGSVAERRKVPYTQMMYNNTITSFGPTTRELIGGSVWNRVTPIDLSTDGVYTYPLIASNRYTVGTATVVLDHGVQTITYRLNSSSIMVHSESLVIYPDLQALRTGARAESFSFGKPIDIQTAFGDDRRVIIAITLKADYDAVGFGVQYFAPDQAQIDVMIALLD